MTHFEEMDEQYQEYLRSIGSKEAIPLSPKGEWPDPDMTVIRPERPPAPKMTEQEFADVFGAWSPWLMTAASVKSAPVDFVALALLSTASAIIGNTRWAVPWDGWKEPPIIWGMLIGEPSSGKSPALDALLDAIKAIDAEFSRQYKKDREEWLIQDELARIALAQWKSDVKAAIADGKDTPAKPDAADAGPPPTRKRVRITDATTESVAALSASIWRGLLLSRDELSGWLGSMDRYSGGGDRPFWLEAFGGRSFTVDRKGKPDPIIVDHLSVSILGGTQPDKLESMLVNSDDDGLPARFFVVYPDQVPLQRPTASLNEQFAIDAFKRLLGLEPSRDDHGAPFPLFVHLEEEAKEALHEFRKQCREWEGDAHGLMKSHIGKLPGLAVRVSLVLALLDWSVGDSDMPVSSITADHLGRACRYVGDHLRKHAHRAYGAASAPVEIRNARRIAEIIQAENLTEIGTRNIQRRGLAGLQTAKGINAAIAVLVGADWVAPMESPANKSGGRPRKIFEVNPKLGKAKCTDA